MFSEIVITYDGPPKISRRDENEIKKKGMRRAPLFWHAEIRPTKFTPAGARRYRMGRRFTKDIYAGRVRRTRSGRPRAPSGNPLTWSGRTLARSRTNRITVTSTRARLIMPVNALNFRPPKNPLNMRDEFIRTTRADEQAISSEVGTELSKQFESYPYATSTIRIRG